MITTSTRFDTEDQFSWDSITSTFEDQTLIFRETVYDNGIARSEEFLFGVRASITQYDNVDPITGEAPEDGGAVSWTEQYIEYDPSGTIEFRDTLFDSGVQRIENFQNGVRSITMQYDNIDPITGEAPEDGGAVSWTEQITSYDLNGEIEGRNTVFDDGVTKLEFFQNGVRTTTIQLDNVDPSTFEGPEDGGARNWIQLATSYDENGTIEQRSTVFDNGIFKIEDFENGVRSSTIQYDNLDFITGEAPADGGAVSWTEQSTYYDPDGVLEFRETTYDDGILRLEEFENGVRSVTTQFDNDDAVSWTEQTTHYDVDGALEFRETTYDNGIFRFEEFENGVRSITFQLDNDDAVSWTEQTTFYEADGALEFRETTYDNGIYRFEEFENDVRSVTFQLDNDDAVSWTEQTTHYDVDGALEFRETTYDNGIFRFEEFENGVRSVTTQFDRDDAVSWTEQYTEYNADGSIYFRSTTFDNGTIKGEQFDDDGELSITATFDAEDVFVWEGVASFYEDGELASELTLFDNQDQLVEVYENEEQVVRLELDADGSEDWTVRLTEYGANGPIVTTYDSRDDLADEYDMLFYEPLVAHF